MNDASAIVLFTILLGLAQADDTASLSLAAGLFQFIDVFFGGIVVGAIPRRHALI